MANEYKFQPTQIADAINKKLVIKRLPEWMQNLEQIQMFCDDVIQQWFNPVDQEIVDGYIGDNGSPAAAGKIFLNEMDEQRQAYQLSPAYVSRNPDNSVRSVQFYSDLVGYLGHYGALTEDQSRLLSGKFYSWTPPINPNKLQNFSSYLWDGNNEFGIKADYVVMERGADNGNLWSLQNYWYTIGQTLPDGTTLTEQMSQDAARWTRAQAPIIEYNKNIEIINYGTNFRGVVNYLSDTLKPEDIVQQPVSANIRIDGYILKAGDRILFTSMGNPGENNRIYKIYVKTMDNGDRVYGVVLDEDEQNPSRPTGEPHKGDNILIKSGKVYGNKMVHWTGTMWSLAQVKDGINAFPQFQLYDKRGVKLNDPTIYSNSDFSGSSLFGLKVNFNYGEDKVYKEHVELSKYNYYIFDNFLQSIRYNYTKAGATTEISGLYYYNVITDGEMQLKSDWVRSDEESKQFVRQVPAMSKTSMYRVFNNVYEMTIFKNPLENMYAYVTEDDQTYQYYQADKANFLAWHKTSSEGIQSDIYAHSFELSQKVDLTAGDILYVYLDGERIFDFNTIANQDGKIDQITLDKEVKLTETSVLEIKTYSETELPDLELGAYEIPINLQNNPYNDFIDFVHQGDYTPHFLDIIGKNITRGSVNDLNNYEERLAAGLVDNSVGTKIIQNETSLLPLMLHSSNENLDLFAAIMFVQKEYFRFINKFNRTMLTMYENDAAAFTASSATSIVDQILTTINVGKDTSFPFAFDGMGSTPSLSRTFIPPTPAFLGIETIYRPEKATYLYAGRELSCYNIDHMGNYSKAYRVLNGVSMMDDVVYELENRIFNSLDNSFKTVDHMPPMDASTLRPTPFFTDTEYTTKEYNVLSLRGYVNFIASNGIDNSTHDYDATNWLTWNYTGTTYVVDGKATDIPARGSWRAIYMDMFGTINPATHPWQMFGFTQRPDWFNQEYEPTKVRLGQDPQEYIYVYEAMVKNEAGQMVPSGLWDTAKEKGDASKGVILAGARAGQYDKYRRFGKQPFTITGTGKFTSDGEQIMKFALVSPHEAGMVSGALTHMAEPWVYGDMGDMEFTYMNTVMFSYDKAMALLRAKPGKFANYFYDTKGSTLQHVTTDGSQFLYGDTNLRLNFNKKTLVHTEQGIRILGYQTWVSDYLIYQSKSVSANYGDILRSSVINIGHRIGGFTKEDQVSFTSDTFGLVSKENQHIGLVRSSAFRDEALSAVKITWTGQGFAVSGYDLVGATFKYKVPNKNGRRRSIDVGRRSVVYYNEYLEQYGEIEYGTLLKTFQEVYAFICGYGKYLEDRGWIFEDQSEDGVIQDWGVIGREFVEWSASNPAPGEFISVSPSTKNAKFGSLFGSVLSVTQFNGGVWSLLDDTNTGIRPYEINTSRIGNVFSVRLEDDSDKRMALIRVSLVSFEHAFVFDDTTIFGNSIYIPKYGSVLEMLRMYGYVTGGWNGRLEANGFIILEKGTLPSFEKLVTDFQHYYDIDSPVDDPQLRNLARHLIGFQTREYLAQMIANDTSQTEFYQGFIREKGSNQVFAKVLRVSKTYNTDNYKVLQEWAFKVGEYGNLDGNKYLEFKLNNTEMKQEPQMVTFNENATSQPDANNIVFFGKQGTDPRWLDRPKDAFSFPVRKGASTRIQLTDIGPVGLNEISYSTLNFETAYTDRLGYKNTVGANPTSVWMFTDQNQNWNIFELVKTPIYLESIVPFKANTPDDELPGKFCTLTFSAAHGLSDGDYFFLEDTSEFMPDALRSEAMYYTSTSNPRTMLVPLNVDNTYKFATNKPVLYKYITRFATKAAKDSYVAKKYSFSAPDLTLFARPTTYDITNNVTDSYINLFDPINGVIPGAIVSDVTYTTPVDPAKYNSDDQSIIAWGSEQVGKVWWDTTHAFFLDYTRPVLDANGNVKLAETLEYKRTNWGKLLPHSSIDIYEWVESPVLPYEWDKYCQRQAVLNKNTNSWVPSGVAIQDSHSTFEVYEESTGEYKTMYYFWVRNTIYVPNAKGRSKPCFEIARLIENPLLLGTPWFAAIDNNSFIVSGIQHNVTDDKTVLSISYRDDATEVVKHEQYQLCQEGSDYNFNPDVWKCLWNSLRSQETLPNGKVENLQYPFNDLGFGPNKTMIRYPIEARRTFVDSANAIYQTINMTTNQVVMDEVFNVKTKETNPNIVSFRVLSYNNQLVIMPSEQKFVENDAVLVSSNGTLPTPLNSTSVYFVHFDENNYIQLMNSPSTGGSAVTIPLEDRGEGQLGMIKQSDYIDALGTSLDMTQYWSLADWYSVGFNAETIYTEEVSIDAANQKNYQEGDVIRVVDSSGTWTLYVKHISRNVVLWEAIGREKSTVALNDQLYHNYVQYNEDGSPTNVELNVRRALGLLQNSFAFVQSRLVFDMVKYIHTEQTVVDWVFKTSYIYVVGLDQSLQKSYITNDNLIGQIVDYFEEVKPYRTKIRSQIEQKTSDDDEINGLMNDLDPTGFIFVNGAWVKTQKDVWDYESAKFNPVTNRWEIDGSLPADFVTPNRRFQQQYDLLMFDNTKCTPDKDLGSVEVLEEIASANASNKADRLTDTTMYKLQRYTFSSPQLNIVGIQSTIKTILSGKYPQFNTALELQAGINDLYKKLKNDLAACNQLTVDIDAASKAADLASPQYNDLVHYIQFNTLANRVKLYSSRTDEQISQEVGCPFKGKTLTDNPNTRLPFGFGASNGANFGYVMYSKEAYDKFVKKVRDEHPSFSDVEVVAHLAYEYGLYAWKYDMYDTEDRRIYDDTLYVLTGMRNLYNPEKNDTYEIARQILSNPTIDNYAMVMIPRKLVYVYDENTRETIAVPNEGSIAEFMEENYNNTGVVLSLAEINLDDLPLDKNNLLYNDYKEVMSSFDDAKYFDDMNAFDNLGFESQTKQVVSYAEDAVNPTQDSSFIDISDINPMGKKVSQMRFTVSGYGYDTSGNAQIRDQGNFHIEGHVILNPYNAKEVLVSIPRYDVARKFMDRSILSREEVRYSYGVKDVVATAGRIRLRDANDFKVGEKVAVFTSDASDLDFQLNTGSWNPLLKVANIKTGNRPRLFPITAVSGDTITIGGLVFESTYDSKDTTLMNGNVPLALNVVRVTAFTDPEFTVAGIKKYTNDRSYRVNVLDYDVFYDRELIGSKYTDKLAPADYTVWYCTNEFGIDADGNEVDHGYNLPIYGKGVLSELVRTGLTDSLQIFVYQYDANVIKPVKSGNKWNYTGTLVKDVYVSDAAAKLSVLFKSDYEQYQHMSLPKSVTNVTILDGKMSGTGLVDGVEVAVNSEIVGLTNKLTMVRGLHGTAEPSYKKGKASTYFAVNLGKLSDMETYANNYQVIPLAKYSAGLAITGTDIGKLLK